MKRPLADGRAAVSAAPAAAFRRRKGGGYEMRRRLCISLFVLLLLLLSGCRMNAPPEIPSAIPSEIPAELPPAIPSEIPSEISSVIPAELPSEPPPEIPPEVPSEIPSEAPPEVPSEIPSETPPEVPSEVPPEAPSEIPADAPVGSPAQPPSETSVLVNILESKGFTVENNGQHIEPGGDAVFLLKMSSGYSLADMDYDGAYRTVVNGRQIELTLENVQAPASVALRLTSRYCSITYEPNGGTGDEAAVTYDTAARPRPNTSNGAKLFY